MSNNREVVYQMKNAKLNQDFTGLSRPIFVNISSNGPTILYQIHNESKGLGAFYQVTFGSNVTIMYKVVNGVNGTLVELYGRDGNNYLNNSIAEKGLELTYVTTVTENVTLDYYNPVKKLVNASVSYYSVKITINSDFFMFWAYVRDSASPGSESSKGIYNLLTTGGKFYSKAVEDYFIQSENVTIALIGENMAGNATYYLEWRENDTSVFNRIKINTGLSSSQTGNFNVTVTLSKFDIGTGIEFRMRVMHNDSHTGLFYEVFEPALHEVGVFDGRPTLILNTTTIYTKETTYNVTFETSVPKGQITNIQLNISGPVKSTTNLPGNTTFYVVNLNTEGNYSLTFTAFTDKGLNASKTLIIIADRSNPEFNVYLASGKNNILGKSIKITDQERELKLNITAFDKGEAGVELIVVNYGDNITHIYTENGIYTHKYNSDGTYNVTITVIDHAGNTAEASFLVIIHTFTVNTDRVGMNPQTAFLISAFSLLLAFALNRRKQK